MSLAIALGLNLFVPLVYADNTTIDSIASVNKNDDGVTAGSDVTQKQKTTYNEETTSPINTEGTQAAFVYVSQSSTFSATIPKTIILDGKKDDTRINKGVYVVTVSGNIGGEETIDVVPESSFTLKQLGKNDINATVEQDKIKWKHNEIDVVGNGVISTNEMSAGSWNGSFIFNIKLANNAIVTVSSKNEAGEDLYASASNITGAQKDELLTKLEETGLVTDEVDALIEVKSNDFDGLAETTFNVSSIAKEGDKVTILHYDTTKNEWEYIGTEIVDSNGQITSNFSSYSPVAFVVVKDNGYEIIEMYRWGKYSINNVQSGLDGYKEELGVEQVALVESTTSYAANNLYGCIYKLDTTTGSFSVYNKDAMYSRNIGYYVQYPTGTYWKITRVTEPDSTTVRPYTVTVYGKPVTIVGNYTTVTPTKGDFIGYAYGNNENTYPEDGAYNGYWYVKAN